jgi:uncharacterized protein (TIGR02996 family)
MAKYDVTHSCGHVEEVQLFGRTRDRESRIEWLGRSGLCSACYAERNRQEREAAGAAATKWAADQGLPTLVGSEKQCSWAEKIRQEKAQQIANHYRRAPSAIECGNLGLSAEEQALYLSIAERPTDITRYAVAADYLGEHGRDKWAAELRAVMWLLSQTDAKWWIDTRSESVNSQLSKKIHEPEILAREEAARKAKEEAEAEARRQEEEKTRRQWEKKEAIARAVHDFLNGGHEVRWQVEEDTKVVTRSAYRTASFRTKADAEAFAARKRADLEAIGHKVLVMEVRPERPLVNEIKVWDNGRERRVYVGRGYNATCATYYYTGNHRAKPGSLELSDAAREQLGDRVEEFKAFLAQLCRDWQQITVGITPDGNAANG